MANIEASQVAGKNNWALLLDLDGFIAEGTGDNFFIVRKGEILTPEGRNILRGISRAYIFELADELSVSCRESNLETYDVHTADEAFMSGTPFCILPVTSLNGAAIGDGKVGPVFTKLLSAWSKNMEVDIKDQIQKWNSVDGLQVEDTPTPYQFKK